MLYMPFTDGGPMYCLMSALSTNAKSIFSVTLDVVRITTLECLQYEHKGCKDMSKVAGASHHKSVKRSSAVILHATMRR